jgi:hypothetical protein
MKLKVLVLFIVIFNYLIYSQEEISPWEKLGLSKTEWIMIQDNKIPDEKVEELLKAGIGIGEYVNKPWVNLGMSEEKWINKRRSGLTNDDINSKVASSVPDSSLRAAYKANARDDFRSVSKNGEKFSSLFLPGYQQHKSGRKVQRNFMLALAGGSLGWCVGGSIYNKRFEFLPIFCITVPTMIWSFADYSAHSKK